MDSAFSQVCLLSNDRVVWRGWGWGVRTGERVQRCCNGRRTKKITSVVPCVYSCRTLSVAGFAGTEGRPGVAWFHCNRLQPSEPPATASVHSLGTAASTARARHSARLAGYFTLPNTKPIPTAFRVQISEPFQGFSAGSFNFIGYCFSNVMVFRSGRELIVNFEEATLLISTPSTSFNV